MSKFVRSLALFVAGLPLTSFRSMAGPAPTSPTFDNPDKAVSLRPLNIDMDNLFASHSSHSSHRSHSSHSSHYSSSGGGGYVAPRRVAPSLVMPASSYSPTPQAAPASTRETVQLESQPAPVAAEQPTLTLDEKRRLQVIRVQIRLNSLMLYDGQIHGALDDETKRGLKLFQKVKGLPETGLMSTATLNALGIPAVH